MHTKIDENDLVQRALDAAGNAHAPYSKFRVGAAVLLQNGEVITGNNQENRVYPLGSCAERVAVNYARANHPKQRILAIAVASPDADIPVSPCGGCREVLMEVVRDQRENGDIRVIMANRKGETRVMMASELLPHSFQGDRS